MNLLIWLLKVVFLNVWEDVVSIEVIIRQPLKSFSVFVTIARGDYQPNKVFHLNNTFMRLIKTIQLVPYNNTKKNADDLTNIIHRVQILIAPFSSYPRLKWSGAQIGDVIMANPITKAYYKLSGYLPIPLVFGSGLQR